MSLDEIKTPNLDHQPFQYENQKLDFSILDFWKWNQSDLVENRNRGILAEFIVKQGLGIKNETRLEWDSFDLKKGDLKIEIKSAAYIQTWKQKKFSSIDFNISPKRVLLEDNNYLAEQKRQADIYIFCLLHHKDQATINPIDLTQWTFYVVETSVLNEKFGNQKTLRLSSLERIEHRMCNYSQLRIGFEEIEKLCLRSNL